MTGNTLNALYAAITGKTSHRRYNAVAMDSASNANHVRCAKLWPLRGPSNLDEDSRRKADWRNALDARQGGQPGGESKGEAGASHCLNLSEAKGLRPHRLRLLTRLTVFAGVSSSPARWFRDLTSVKAPLELRFDVLQVYRLTAVTRS